jgi:hypothetical protein
MHDDRMQFGKADSWHELRPLTALGYASLRLDLDELPTVVRSIAHGNRARCAIHVQRHIHEWCVGRPLNNGAAMRGIEGGAVAWAEQQFARRIVLHWAAFMGAGSVERDEAAIGEMHQYTRIAIGRERKG